MLELQGITKNFGAVKALCGANLTLRDGEIRALLGANGSGKSTMVKVLGGLIHKDAGSIRLGGAEISIPSPKASHFHGIGAAYQDLSLVPRLTVAENIALGHEPAKLGLVDRKRTLATAMETLEIFKAGVDPANLVMDLDPARQSLVEIAKTIAWKPRIILLDEVTASLHKEQVKLVFELLRTLRAKGTSILFVSHRLDEVFELCDSASILRGGESVADVTVADVTENDLVFHMTGMRIEEESKDRKKAAEANNGTMLEVRNLTVGNKVSNVSCTAARGEIVGIGGLQGQGQGEFLRALYGYTQPDEGTILLEGKEIKFKAPADAVLKGFGFIPGDREREGIFQVRPIVDNIFMAEFGIKPLVSYVHTKGMSEGAMAIIDRLKIKIGSPQDPARSLSGGNQQKLIVGRWIKGASKILLLDDPTKGVDVTSRREIHDILRSMASQGATILISSSDNEELLEISDRIIVFYEGRIVTELSGDTLREDTLVAAMLGVSS